MVKPYLNQVNGKLNNDINLFTGGLNTYMDKAFINQNQMPYVMNMTMVTPPKMETRPFRVTLASYMENQRYTGTKRILDMYASEALGVYVIVSADIEARLEMWRDQNGNWGVQDLGSLGYAQSTLRFCHCWQATQDYLYIMNTWVKYKLTFGEGTPVLTQIQDGIYGIPEFHKGRLFIADPVSRIVTYSALYDFDNFDQTSTTYYVYNSPNDFPNPDEAPTDKPYLASFDNDYYQLFDPNPGYWSSNGTLIAKSTITVSAGIGTGLPDYSICAGDFKVTNAVGRVVGVKSFDDKLYIFCEESMHLLYGSTPDPSLSNSFQLVDLNNGIGAYSSRCITVGADRLFWLGSDKQVYEHSGSSTYMISRPTEDGTGGIDNIFNRKDIGTTPQMCATASRLYFNVKTSGDAAPYNDTLFVYDVYNKCWWAEDGEFTSICASIGNLSEDMIFMCTQHGDIQYTTAVSIGDDTDVVYDFENNVLDYKPIRYSFQTRVYGVDGVDMRKTLSDVWFQAKADATVYLGNLWTAQDFWEGKEMNGYVDIGKLKYITQPKTQPAEFDPDYYEQQRAKVPLMYGQRLNAFSIVVKGTGRSEFYLMKRNWRAS